MEWHELAGYTLLGVGIILIIFALLAGYGMYSSLSATLSYYTITPTSTNSSLNSTLSSLGSLGPQLKFIGQNDAALFAEIAILFLIAGIGYKFCIVGMRIINTYASQQATPPEETETEEQ